MPFGLRNDPATFQRALDIILSGVRWQICVVYLDDVIVFSCTVEQHVKHLDTVLSLLRSAVISLKLKKCAFFQRKVRYLGHVINPSKLQVAEDAALAFASAEFLRILTQARSFLGACNVCRRFVQGFSQVAKPRTYMTRKNADVDWDRPTDAQVKAFEELRNRMVSPPVLAFPRLGKPYVIDTDASADQLGCTLL